MWAWVISAEGQAVATWISAVLSVLAIVIALAVALFEQRRANSDRLAEIARQDVEIQQREARAKERRSEFINACSTQIETARALFEGLAAKARPKPFVDWSPTDKGPQAARRCLSSLRALQSEALADHRVISALSIAIVAVEEIEHIPDLGNAPSGPNLANALERQCGCLGVAESLLQLALT
jgi:signal transduction histidine kinase